MAHNRVTPDTVDPIAIHLAAVGFHAGHDHTIRILAASLAAAAVEALDFDVDALVAHYHELVKELTPS